jgi:hypothetical protein
MQFIETCYIFIAFTYKIHIDRNGLFATGDIIFVQPLLIKMVLPHLFSTCHHLINIAFY